MNSATYWVARRRGMKVEAFAIGFGPKIFSWVRDGIEYSVRWIPAGGFVKLPQMITSAAIEGDAGDKEVPPAPPLLQNPGGRGRAVYERRFRLRHRLRHIIGSACLCQVNPSIIGYVEPGTPEAALGIRDGDEIVAVNGQPVKHLGGSQ
jgi:regulator of sigma E protease